MKRDIFILFDLGGVLVELGGAPVIMKWMDRQITIEELNDRWLHSSSVRAYESGLISKQEFSRRVIEEFGFNIDDKEFLDAFYSFPKGLYKGVDKILEELRKDYPVGCLSNTNEMHWERICREYRIHEYIPLCLLSFETGFMKPDKEAFFHAAEKTAFKPQNIIFLDDNPTNVQKAKEVGFEAYYTTGSNLKEKLSELGLIKTI